MATLTYDPTPADQPEFTAEEQDSIQVGEQLEQQQSQLLAGKYKDAQELEKAYMSLQSKLGEQQPEEQEQVQEEPEEESEPESEPEEEQEEQEENPFPMSEQNINTLMEVAGGSDTYNQMTEWAKENFSEQEIALYDHVMGKNDAAAAMFAVQALKNAYLSANGTDGQMIQGKAAPPEQQNVFRSQAEVIEAMNDPRYDKDPAYRNDVFTKLERSNVQF